MVVPRHSKCITTTSGKDIAVVDIHKIIGKIPIKPKKGFMLYKHKYTGPYNPLDRQLDEYDQPIKWQEPYNAVDAISMHHDICYRDHPNDKHACDDKMLQELTVLKPKRSEGYLQTMLMIYGLQIWLK